MPTAIRSRAAVGALLASLALPAACDGTSTVDGVLAPSALSGAAGGAVGGATVVPRGTAALVGSWTRVASGAPGVLVEQTFLFSADGSGQRLTVSRTALGVALAAEQQRFTWTAGGGVLSLRFERAGTATALVRASYQLLLDATGTVLRIDGVEYLRTGG
ncbi:hypothetical protein [Roseisolibacter sp. H3M3-2]|uniref:hypothetical protein n=1 Tax=Roseisolibacter sp. H3M3-2 TaxID=3031323 RepID=UPI0023DA10A1|nr:hypothetical protein [Roseisolibacter sp. H3M3-2]MDF1505909.1 hypothetical protein [Roseisolibacter sp. H3M3-2]